MGSLFILLVEGMGVKRVWDSTIVKDNTFNFAGTLAEPSNGFITILKFDRVNNLEDKNITKRLFIGPSQMTISLVLDSFHNTRTIWFKITKWISVTRRFKTKIL